METKIHTISFGEKRIHGEDGSNLRKVLIDAGVPPYNGAARNINCHGLGTCGTCAVEIEGQVSPMTAVESWRLSFPPHRKENGLRLACQCQVQGDLVVKKHPGFWGHDVARGG
jgi:ferredoxin